MVFSIKNIFNPISSEGALAQHGAIRYYIAPYQRGYKWKSFSKDDSVCVLLKDLLDATENRDSEYYLQFITTKLSTVNGEKVLEVIDGQQRLTTLTLLLSILAFKTENSDECVSNNLLLYEVRPTVTMFFKQHIYSDVGSILTLDWEDFLMENSNTNEQDIFYLFSAVKKISAILDERGVDFSIVQTYILDNVKIILNNIESSVNCEEMFSNLNDNKIELTNSELIKGLFLTKSARDGHGFQRITYKEVLELRAVMGRQWDELAHWANHKEIKSFYFGGRDDVMDQLLQLLALQDGYEFYGVSQKNSVFNFFQARIKKNVLMSKQYFSELIQLKLILNDWYCDEKIHNLLGFLFFSKGKAFRVADTLGLLKLSKSEVKKKLQSLVIQLFPSDDEKLEYGINHDKLHNTLLALSVFNVDHKFDFVSFSNPEVSWSLEHIFPQNPDQLPEKLRNKDMLLIKALIKGRTDNFKKVKNKLNDFDETMDVEKIYDSLCLKLSLKECVLSSDEKEILYRIIRIETLNDFGNMALLTKSDNSSNKNGMFDKKRQNIARRVSEGRFVPKHTYDVFSKLISDKMTPELSVWSADDIEIHGKWAQDTILAIKKTFQ